MICYRITWTAKICYFCLLIIIYHMIVFNFSEALTDGFSCPDGDVVGPNGRILPHPTFAHPDDCQKFYICRNGVIPQYGSCSAGSVYNDVSFKCDEPENVPGWWVMMMESWYTGQLSRDRRNNHFTIFFSIQPNLFPIISNLK